MPFIRVRNSSAAAQAPQPPTGPGGRPYTFEMIYDGGSSRAYADAPAGLVEALSPDYPYLDSPRERAAARIRIALRFQVQLQARLASSPQLQACSREQQAVLLASREVPPAVQRWDAPVPLVLVSVFYVPTGRIARPQTPDASAVVWIDTDDDWSLLLSLHHAGALSVHVRQADPPRSAEH